MFYWNHYDKGSLVILAPNWDPRHLCASPECFVYFVCYFSELCLLAVWGRWYTLTDGLTHYWLWSFHETLL